MLLWTGGRTVAILGAGMSDLRETRTAALLASTGKRVITVAGAAIVPASTMPPESGYHGAIEHKEPPPPSRQLDRIPIIRAEATPQEGGPVRQAMLRVAIPGPAGSTRTIRAAMATASAIPAASPGSPPASISVPAAGPPAPLEEYNRNRPAQRWSGSAWVLWRDDGNAQAIGSAGQLGGAQAGIRVDRHLGKLLDAMPLSAYARLTAALRDPVTPEAALGLALYPVSGRTPLMIGVERRVALDRDGRDAFAILAATGLNPTEIMGGLIAEGYAQAGMVGFSRNDLFADGRISLTALLDRKSRTGAGFSLSGGAQPGLSRLDVGPVLQTRLPLGAISPRLSVEWRQRIAGNARPGSGIAVTLASDF